MKCPNSHESFQEIKIGKVKIDQCSQCNGLWFEKDELRQAKDSEEEYAKWFDFDLWNDEKKFTSDQDSRLCPADQTPMFKLKYGDSEIEIDACKKCSGIWLDEGEFKSIIKFVKGASAYDLIHNYLQTALKEGKEIFTGPENLQSEIADFLLVIKLLKFKVFATPALNQFLMNLPLNK